MRSYNTHCVGCSTTTISSNRVEIDTVKLAEIDQFRKESKMNIPDKMNCWGDFPAMVGYAACYEALAEECMELAHCALKLARVLRGDNPVKEDGTIYLDKLDEEYTDVVSCAIALELKPNADISVWKWERHKKRLEERGDN